jgi:hypothetical protein
MSNGESSYPPYIDDLGHGQGCMAFPGAMKDSHAYLFAFQGDAPAIQSLVDKFLNPPNNDEIEYSLIGDSVFITFMHVEKLSSEVDVIGYSDDHECGIWVPLLARPKNGMERIVFWMPYIVIDVYEGMVTGREGWGYRKCYGNVTVANSPAEADLFEAATHLFRTFSPQTEGRVETLVTVRRDPGSEDGHTSEWTKLADAARDIKQLWTGGTPAKVHLWQILIDVAIHLLKEQVPIVNLKQFRDVQDSTRACYQAITEAGIGIHKFKGGGFLKGTYTLDILPAASHPIAQDLGIAVPARAQWAIWALADMSADTGKEVWKAT